MFNLNRITLIGNTGGDPKITPNGPTTLSLATMSLGPTSKRMNAGRAQNGINWSFGMAFENGPPHSQKVRRFS